MKCPICQRQLKSRKSQALGVGPVCKKKADKLTIEVLKRNGLDGVVIKEGVQLIIPDYPLNGEGE